MEVGVGTNYYAEDLASDLFDQIDDLLEFPNDDELLIEMVGPSVSANESLAPIIAPSGGSSVEEAFDAMLLPLMEDHSFLVDTRRDSCNGSGFINTGDISSVEEDHLGHCDELEMTQLEWLANFFDEPASASSLPLENHVSVTITTKTPMGPTSIKCPTTINPTPTLSIPVPSDIIIKDEPSLLFCTSSPVSVLEQTSFSNGDSSGNSGNNSSGGSSATSSLSSTSYFSSKNFSRASLSPRAVAPPEPNFVIPARRRSKRPRPASFSPNRLITTPSLPPSLDIKPIIETMAESEPIPTPISIPVSVSVYELPTQIKKKKKTGPKKSSFIESGDEEAEWGQVQVNETGVRRCMHCQIEKTPQWRAGPMGPKTLCNACGVRYKSGRLFPEYRPAASPTFVPAIHSNSHKKVVEMRLKTTDTVRPRGSGLLGMIRKRE